MFFQDQAGVTPQLKYIAILVAKMADQDWDTVTYLRKTVKPKDAKKTQVGFIKKVVFAAVPSC